MAKPPDVNDTLRRDGWHGVEDVLRGARPIPPENGTPKKPEDDAAGGTGAERFAPEPVDLVDLLAKEFPPLDWRISDVLVQGAVGWIGGPPKLAKSLVGLHACLCVASGAKFLGKFDVVRGRALYVSEEDPERIVYRRVQRLWKAVGTAPERDRFRAVVKAGFLIDREPCVEWLRDELARQHADLVVLDVLNRMHHRQGNDAAEMIPLLAALDKVRTESGSSIWIVAHFKKPQPGQAHDAGGAMLAGSVALHGFSECSIYMDRAKDGQRRLAFEAKEFDGHKPMFLRIGSTANGDDEKADPDDDSSPIYLQAVEPPDNADKGEANRELARRALGKAWEQAGRPACGVPKGVIMAALKEIGGKFGEKTLLNHLKALALALPSKQGRQHELRFHPSPTSAETVDVSSDLFDAPEGERAE